MSTKDLVKSIIVVFEGLKVTNPLTMELIEEANQTVWNNLETFKELFSESDKKQIDECMKKQMEGTYVATFGFLTAFVSVGLIVVTAGMATPLVAAAGATTIVGASGVSTTVAGSNGAAEQIKKCKKVMKCLDSLFDILEEEVIDVDTEMARYHRAIALLYRIHAEL